MKRYNIIYTAVVLTFALAGCQLFTGTSGKSTETARAMSPYQMFEPSTEAEVRQAALDGEVSPGYVIARATRAFDPAILARWGASVAGTFEVGDAVYYRLYRKDGTVKLVNSLRKTPGVVYAQYELRSSIPQDESSSADSGAEISSRGAAAIKAVFDDPMTWGRFGHFETTKALDAYKAYGVGTNLVYVADIDTGINRTHEDFQANGGQIIEYAKSAFDSSDGGSTFSFVGNGNSFVDVPEDEDWDEEGHGTHTAGTIAAIGNNGKGVAGVAWKNVRLISYKCFSDEASTGSGSDWAVYGGLADLISWKSTNAPNQTIPVNMSLGSSYAGYFELDMINQALANGIMVVASMGNSGYNAPQYPAAYAGVLAVGATKADGTKVNFSTSGNFISVSAPGYNIYSTFNEGDNSYVDMSGTSMAAPFVTGTLAYLLSFDPTLSPDQLKTIVESTAMDIGDTGWDEDTGYGLVDVKAAADLVKGGNVPASGSAYSPKKATIYVENTESHYDSGITGHESAVVGQTIYVYDSDGDYVCLGITNAVDGSAEFKLMKPGNYTAKTTYLGVSKSLAFSVSATSDQAATFSFNVPVVGIQTVYNLATDPSQASAADTIISLYDSSGNTLVDSYDSGALDSLWVAGLESGQTYRVGITQYNNTKGEYGLRIGYGGVDTVNTTNGRGVVGSDDSFEPNEGIASAKAVSMDTDYGLYLGNADFFSFTMP